MALIHIECCLTDFLLENYKRRDGFFKHFHKSLYDKYSWMTGSCKLNKMFCFPCLLFSESSSVWNGAGFKDINNLVNSAKKHVQTEKHIRSCLSLHDFGTIRIETFLLNSFETHNRKVDRNRKLMKRFIDTILIFFLVRLPFLRYSPFATGMYLHV